MPPTGAPKVTLTSDITQAPHCLHLVAHSFDTLKPLNGSQMVYIEAVYVLLYLIGMRASI